MIVTSLGNTLTDVADDITSANYINVPVSVGSGLINGDGWAIMLSLTGLYLIYKLVNGAKAGVKTIRTLPSSISAKSTQRYNQSINQQIKMLEAKRRRK